jgi:hypothetical protein
MLVNAWFFRIFLALCGVVGLMGFGEKATDWWVHHDFMVHGKPATGTAAKSLDLVHKDGFGIDYYLPLRIDPGAGNAYTRGEYLDEHHLNVLKQEGRVQYLCLPADPQRCIFADERTPPLGLGWLIFGLLGFGVFGWSLRLPIEKEGKYILDDTSLGA